jgi:hypothetical protein
VGRVAARALTAAIIVAALFAGVMVFRRGAAADRADGHAPSEWATVLSRKKEWQEARSRSSAEAKVRKQAWVDALAEFSDRHPGHARAREAHELVVLEYARELYARGDYEAAARVYESLVARRPSDPFVRSELAAAVERQTVSGAELAQVSPGMSRPDVVRILGAPAPGWTRRSEGAEGWYYRRPDGGVCAVFFEADRVFATDGAATRP